MIRTNEGAADLPMQIPMAGGGFFFNLQSKAAAEDSPMKMLTLPPPPHLAGLVTSLWALRGCVPGRYAGLPKPHVELIFSLSGEHDWQCRPDAPKHRYRTAWITPLQLGPRFAETQGDLHLVGVRLGLAGARLLFGILPIGDGTAPLDAEAVLGREAAELHEALALAADDRHRLALLCRWLERRLCGGTALRLPDPALVARSRWRSDALADLFGLSGRGLRKRFSANFAVSPKMWLQLTRFDFLLRDGSFHSGDCHLAGIAQDFGFADQAHMTREFHRFSGAAPQAYLASRRLNQSPTAAPHFLPKSNPGASAAFYNRR